MKVFLVQDASALKYDEQYKIFIDFDEAVVYAKSRGLQTFGEPSQKIGVMNVTKADDIFVFLLPLEVEDEAYLRRKIDNNAL